MLTATYLHGFLLGLFGAFGAVTAGHAIASVCRKRTESPSVCDESEEKTAPGLTPSQGLRTLSR